MEAFNRKTQKWIKELKKIESNRVAKLAKVEGKRREAVGRKRQDQLKRDMIRQEYESALDQVSFVTSEFMSKRGTLIREDKKKSFLQNELTII